MASLTLGLLLGLFLGYAAAAPEVSIATGKLTGVDKKAITTEKPFHVYYGIPYATAPVGDLRFKAPLPYENDDPSQVINTETFREICFQTNYNPPQTESEDCLFLNVFVPDSGGADFDPAAKKKVMVYIHGGAFTTGDASLFPTSSLVTDYDVIVVIMQYRLGPLGFLSSGDEALPGNNGLRDQIMAIQWTKDNIAAFGGDPDDLTLFGESAGAMSVSLLSLSPLTKGLFTKAQTASANALAPWAIDHDYKTRFYRMANVSKCMPGQENYQTRGMGFNKNIVDCLMKLPAKELSNMLNADAMISKEDALSMESIINYGPVVDGVVLPMDPYAMVADANYLKAAGTLDRKYMLGINNNEPLVFFMATLLNGIMSTQNMVDINDPVAQACVKNDLHSLYRTVATDEMMKMTILEYFYPRNEKGFSTLATSVDMYADIDFVVPHVQMARSLYNASQTVGAGTEIYLGLFDHFPKLKSPDFPLTGTSHAMDLSYLFDEGGSYTAMMFYCEVYTDESRPLMGIYRSMVTNFAIKGNPSIEGVTWPAYERATEPYMSISPHPEVRNDMFSKRVALWTQYLPDQLGVKYPRV